MSFSNQALQQGLESFSLTTPSHDEILKSIVYIQASCVTTDRTMATFIPPLFYDKMHAVWSNFMQEAAQKKRLFIVALAHTSDRVMPPHDIPVPFGDKTWPALPNSTLEVAGVISLSMPASETGPFRGLVQNLFVHPLHRRKGVATLLLQEVEKQAKEAGRWNLMLDTTIGTPAVGMYEKFGWNKLGVVKDYGYRVKEGTSEKEDGSWELELADEVWFWKDLRD